MAKFCSNCGAPMKKKDKVCRKCGVSIEDAEAVPAKEEKTEKPEPGKKKGPRVIKFIAAAAILIAAAAVAIVVVIRLNSYERTVKSMVHAFEDFDMDTLEQITSEVSNVVYEGKAGGDLYEYYKDMVSDRLDYYEDDLGPIKRIQYQITGESEYSRRRIGQVEEWLEKNYEADAEAIGIKKIMAIDMTLTVKGSKRTEKYYVQDLYLIKENGGWKIYYGDMNY